MDYGALKNLPMADEVMDERRPNTQENGRDRAIDPVPIFPTFTTNTSLSEQNTPQYIIKKVCL